MKNKMGPIAVVGMAGIFPKAPDTSRFLDLILQKQSGIVTVPEHRWKIPKHLFLSSSRQPDTAVSDKAGIIENFNFDPQGYRIDETLLTRLDPVHQLALQAGREAFNQCRHTKASRKNTGVILAAIALPTDASNEMSKQILFGPRSWQPDGIDSLRAGMVGVPGALLCRALGFEAGCFTLDAACASSLYAIKLACEYLHFKKADIMVAGGVSRPDCLYTQIGFTQLSALSPSGVCAPFDKNADGLVVGEGTGMVVLKRLNDAIAQKDNILAVIKGSGACNDIEGTLVGPASEGQVRAMVEAYHGAQCSPKDIQYMECHGSGTPVGDQVELSSIKGLFKTFGCSDHPLSIGSVKSTVGHLLTAAGAAGFIKTVLAINKKVLPPSLNFTRPPDKSILNKSRIRVQTEPEKWLAPESGIRRAGISAFGFGGINAHLVIEEYQAERSARYISSTPPSEIPQTVPCAIVGMDVTLKKCEDLAAFSRHICNRSGLNPGGDIEPRSKTVPLDNVLRTKGHYIDTFDFEISRFHVPPNQLEDILPQHLVMLKSMEKALKDAAIPSRPLKDTEKRDRMGCAVGIDFDYGATDFRMRWDLHPLGEAIQNKVNPPLDFNRTLGALGGIVASRLAREFKLGGPCFTLSAGAVSGIKTIETAVHSLSIRETDVFICGCVDLAGDIRQLVLNNAAGLYSEDVLPSEGGVSIVLKRLDTAVENNDRIYAVIDGIAGQSGLNFLSKKLKADDVGAGTVDGVDQFMALSDRSFQDIDILETNFIAAQSLTDHFKKKHPANSGFHLSSLDRKIGYTGGASALINIAGTALNIFEQTNANRTSDAKSPLNSSNAGLVTAFSPDGQTAQAMIKRHTKAPGENTPLPVSSSGAKQDTGYHKTVTVRTNPRPVSQIDRQQIEALFFPIKADDNDPLTDADIDTLFLNPSPFDPCLISKGTQAAAKAHEKFLDFSTQTMKLYEEHYKTLTRMAADVINDPESAGQPFIPQESQSQAVQKEPAGQFSSSPPAEPLFNREQCLEYAAGKAGNVLGETFDIIDTYPARVRLPGEPLMLVDRIMSIEGEMLSLGPGKIITQHDVQKNAWYLDGGKTPVSISIEAGQADLFLCAWLGIDHRVKGKRKYRLLDARVTFHRTLPEPGETIEYHIEIDRFLKQGPVYLFFFHYNGYINDQLLISMRDGCAGFFTEKEVKNSGGIILKKEDRTSIDTQPRFSSLAPVKTTSFPDHAVQALRKGDLETAFGPDFKGKSLGKNLRLPGENMHLIDRVLEFDPSGGRYGLGMIVAQADIHPDDWFLTCHFVDDMVMPGTLMYECCAHTLRIFTQRMGWISDRDDVFYDVLTGNESDLKCRGPVTPQTKKAQYEIEIKQMGYAPEPFVIADAHMFSDDLRIVLYKNMGMKIVGIAKEDLTNLWREK